MQHLPELRYFVTVSMGATALLFGADALSQTRDEDAAVVRASATERDRQRVEDGSGSGTSIDLRERGRTAESLGALLDEAPGLHVRRSGDGFAPQWVTLRGAPAAHVLLALDGVVLNDAATDGVDLSLLPPALVERVDVYRGASPLRLGVSGIGGAIEVIPRDPGTRGAAWATAVVGSFGQRRAATAVGSATGPWRALVSLGYRGTDGDFSFYDDRGNPLVPGVTSVRANNAAEAVDLLYRVCHGHGPLERRVCGTVLAGWRHRGVSGVVPFQSDGPFSEQRRVLARVSVPFAFGVLRASPAVGLVAREDLFVNLGPVPLAGTLPDTTRSTTRLAEVSLPVTARGSRVAVELLARGRVEDFRGLDPLAASAHRGSVLLGAQGEITLGPLRIDAGVGLEVLADSQGESRGTRTLFSPRVGARWAVASALTLRATAGLYARAPTLPELYGDRGLIAGNASLRPERATNIDGGTVVSLRGRKGTLRAEITGYHRSVEDLVVLRQTSRATFRPFNLDRARVSGVELQARGTLGPHLRATVAYAFTYARSVALDPSLDDLPIPGVPAHDLAFSLAGTLGPVRLTAELGAVSSATLDEGGREVIPSRALVGASIAYSPRFARGASVSLSVTNLLDARIATRSLRVGDGTVGVGSPVQDLLGFPLPGRAFFVALGWEFPVRP